MSNRLRRKSKAKSRFFKGGLILAFIGGSIELIIHTGIEEFVKEKLQDWHDEMNVVVEYEGARQLYVVDVYGRLKDSSLVSDLRADLNKLEDSNCRPEWDNEDRARFRKHCAGTVANEIAHFQRTLPADDERVEKLKDLWKEVKKIDAGNQPDGIFVEVTAKLTNYGEIVGRVDQEAELQKGTGEKLPLIGAPGDDREILGMKSAKPSITPRFRNESVSIAAWNEFQAATEETKLYLTIRDNEKNHEKHAEIRSFPRP